jgi:ribosomal protein S18 acetylase RimI-like enzyme
MSSILIRLAISDDAETIHRALLGLGEHVGEMHKITSTADDIRRYGFGDNPCFRVLLAEAGDALAGMCLFFPSFSTWKGRPGVYVQDLYVEPASRGRGVGELLIRAVAMLTRAEGAVYMRLSVDAGNTSAQAFYDRLGMEWSKTEMIRAAYGEAFEALCEHGQEHR